MKSRHRADRTASEDTRKGAADASRKLAAKNRRLQRKAASRNKHAALEQE